MNIEEILHANLTDEQYSAVIDDSRNILCLACAGSGKSRTLAYKIAYLISRGEAPESIIAFTFTEKAAESIKRRVAEALHKFGLSENIVGAMFIGTLDAFCQKLLGDINAKYRQLCAQLRVCSQAGGIPVYPRFSQPDNSESWDDAGNGI